MSEGTKNLLKLEIIWLNYIEVFNILTYQRKENLKW